MGETIVFYIVMFAVFGIGYMIGSIVTGNSWYKHCSEWGLRIHKNINACVCKTRDREMANALLAINNDIDGLLKLGEGSGEV
jgi:hypothetical protein